MGEVRSLAQDNTVRVGGASGRDLRKSVSLERLKIYVALPDAKAERTGYLRIIDESGEDYLYPSQRFVAAELPVSTRRAVLQAA